MGILVGSMLHIDGSCVDLEGEGREGTGRVHGACMQADMQWGKLVQQQWFVATHPLIRWSIWYLITVPE